MIGRFKRAKEVNEALARSPARTPWRRSSTRAWKRGFPRRSSATVPSSRRFDHVIDRDVLVQQPGEQWIRPRAPFRFSRCCGSRAPRRPSRSTIGGVAGSGTNIPQDPAGRAAATRRAAGDRLHRVLGGPVRHRVAVLDGRRRRSRSSRSSAPTACGSVRRSGRRTSRCSTRCRRCATRRTWASAASRSTSATPTGSTSRSG